MALPDFLQTRRGLIITSIAVILVVVIIAFFVFRSPQQEQTSAPPPPDITLTWWVQDNSQAWENLVDTFTESTYGGSAHDHVDIEVVSQDLSQKDYSENLIQEFARNQGPDIFSIPHTTLPAWQEFTTPIKDFSRLVTPQNTYETNQNFLATYRQNFTDIVTQTTINRNEVYGITPYVDNLQMYYNRDLLNQQNIALSPQTSQKWEDIERQSRQINKRQENGNGFSRTTLALGGGLQKPNGDLQKDSDISHFEDIIPTLIWQSGANIYDSQQDKVVLGQGPNQQEVDLGKISNNPNFDSKNRTLSALNYYFSYANPNSSNYSWNPNISPTSNTPETDEQMFFSGRQAYILGYKNFEQEIKERNSRLNYGVTQIPQLDLNNKKTHAKFNLQVLNQQLQTEANQYPQSQIFNQNLSQKARKARERLKQAKYFMHFLQSQRAQQQFINETKLPAARNDLIQQQQQGNKTIRIFARGVLYAQTYYHPNWQATRQIWGELTYSYNFENNSVDKALSRAIEKYSALVSKGPELEF